MPLASINPATGKTVAVIQSHTDAEVQQRITIADSLFRRYRLTSFQDRASILTHAAEILDSDLETFARLMTAEMGKPIKSARDEIRKCAWVCRFYATEGARFLVDEEVMTNAAHSFIRCQPLGIVLAIMPWNFPFWQVFRFAAPALMAGNVALLKHASNVPQCAQKIEEIFRAAGAPAGVFQTLLIESRSVARVISDERVRAVTLTGSEPAGKSVASLAGSLIKKSVLELGGSDPFIVMPGIDVAEAASVAVRARAVNNGQSCVAAKRFIVHKSIAKEFTERFVRGMESLKVGDPMLDDTELGPLASEELLHQLDEQVKRTVALGARVLIGGKRLERIGSFYAPTVLADVPAGSPAYAEELFGPVAMLFEVDGVDQAIQLANDTPFGLGASVWTNDPVEQERFVNELETGMVFFNTMVASDPRLPFGGVKRSGYGREMGAAGIREFVNLKSIWIR